MRFRQVHLDFHTSPAIPEIGAKFDKKEWQETLQRAAVDSITCFSSCHHGWSYHPTQVGKMHSHLNFNLLRAQMDACHEINVKVPVYLTGGVNNVAAEAHPEWREINKDGTYSGWARSPLQPGFRLLCFNTPYLDYLCAMIRETVTLFPDADGIFIDIIGQRQCFCEHCMHDMLEQGLDPEREEDRIRFSRQTLLKYYRRATEAARIHRADMPIFHNSGNVTKGDTEILKYFSHLELESLPTGGWGYDHYPMSAAYCRKLDKEFLGMTGKFHTTWGEFGGFKHPNALRYECAAMLANGSKCSIGDQLHPSGQLDRSTYELIGTAYREVAEKEPWCEHAVSAAKIAVLGQEALGEHNSGKREFPGDIGASRVLLELHQPFDYIDAEMSFEPYRMLILPDSVHPGPELAERLRKFVSAGGKLVLSGTSCMDSENGRFLFDIGADDFGMSEYNPDYIQCEPDFAPSFVSTPFVMYAASRRIKVRDGVRSLGKIFDPYFNRSYRHFSSHQHTPYRPEPSGYDAGALHGNILYFAHPVFTLYRAYGAVAVKEYIGRTLRQFAGADWQVETDLPSQGRVTMMHQEAENRTIVHLLYANTILRGGVCEVSGGNLAGRAAMEVIEDLNPSPAFHLSVAVDRPVRSVTLVPEGKELAFRQKNGRIELDMEPFRCHQMLALQY